MTLVLRAAFTVEFRILAVYFFEALAPPGGGDLRQSSCSTSG